MSTNEEKRARYADLGRRIAKAKAMAERRKQGLPLEEDEPSESNGKPRAAKPKASRRKDGKLVVGPKKLTKKQKDPTLTEKEGSQVDETLRVMLGNKAKDGKTGLTMFQVALVKKIEERGELGVLDLCHMVWEPEEIAQALNNPLSSKRVDLKRIVRNAIRPPKNAGIIGHSSTPGIYVFLGWKKAGK